MIITGLLIIIKGQHPLIFMPAILNVLLAIGTTQFMMIYIFSIHYYNTYLLLPIFVFLPISCDNLFYYV